VVEGLGALEIGEEYAAGFADNSIGFVPCLTHSAIGSGCVVADTVGDVGHNPIECERIGPISFGIGQGLTESVVVLGGFHSAISISGLVIRTISARPDQS
jgi:hypothetical protein